MLNSEILGPWLPAAYPWDSLADRTRSRSHPCAGVVLQRGTSWPAKNVSQWCVVFTSSK